MKVVTYKGYAAAVEFDAEDLILVGRIAGINDVVGFHAETPKELLAAFHEAVDDYLASCSALNKAPDKPYSGRVLLRVNPRIHARIALAARLSGKSINQLGEEALQQAADRFLPDLAA